MSKQKLYNQNYKRFTRPWWTQNLRTLFWVAVVTILVWVYADIEFTDKMELQPRIQVHTGSSRHLTLMSGTETQVSFTISGSRSKLETFRRELRDKGSVIRYDVSEKHGQGRHSVPVVDILNEVENLQREGITVVSVEPRELVFDVDEFVSRELPVEFVDTKGELARVEIDPARVSVRAPQSVWEEIEKIDPQRQVIQLEQIDLGNLQAGKEISRRLNLRQFVDTIPVRTDPEQVQVTLELESNREVRELRVTVQVQSPPQWYEAGETWEKYRLERSPTSDWRPPVRVVGTKAALDNLEANQSEKMNAYIVLGDKDRVAVESYLSREVQYKFDDDLAVELEPGQKITVDFRLVRLSSPTGG
ncbi:MAG: YbbR-like domain-containing protein [Phycisphaerae bacterium]